MGAKVQRVLRMLQHFQANVGRTFTASDLSIRFKSSDRTIRRDIGELVDAGYDIRSSQHGYTMPDDG